PINFRFEPINFRFEPINFRFEFNKIVDNQEIVILPTITLVGGNLYESQYVYWLSFAFLKWRLSLVISNKRYY
ncbi:MAG: hypothetical protein B7Z54_02550, partial [Sphingobacteriales bacterium 12-47-4]